MDGWQRGPKSPLRRELERRYPVVMPTDILNHTLSPYHVFVATAGQERLRRSDRTYLARTVLAIQMAATPEDRDAANGRLTPGARRIWLSIQPEYDGRFDPGAA